MLSITGSRTTRIPLNDSIPHSPSSMANAPPSIRLVTPEQQQRADHENPLPLVRPIQVDFELEFESESEFKLDPDLAFFCTMA